jgi:hypothetical protein
MELSPEDSLRLNVMLANRPQAIRIDESRLIVHALSEKGEAQVRLNPNCRDEQYIKRVRELISGHVLGSPGGYPVYLQRWTRMGQMRDESLEQLLLLGEPEAVVAAVCAPGLNDELARRAWWAMEDAENARQMLTKAEVVQGRMGPILASYLVEHLPFETEPEKMIQTVCLALQPGLIDAEARLELWHKAQRKNAYYLGFLAALPDDLPAEGSEPARASARYRRLGPDLEALAQQGNLLAAQLARVLAPPGQVYLETLRRVFRKPSNQDVINTALDLIAGYFAPVRPEGRIDATLDELLAEAEDWLRSSGSATGPESDSHPGSKSDPTGESRVAQRRALLALDTTLGEPLRAMRVLSGLSYGVVRPVFGDSTAIGSLMRRKLEPVLTPILAQLAKLED